MFFKVVFFLRLCFVQEHVSRRLLKKRFHLLVFLFIFCAGCGGGASVIFLGGELKRENILKLYISPVVVAGLLGFSLECHLVSLALTFQQDPHIPSEHRAKLGVKNIFFKKKCKSHST